MFIRGEGGGRFTVERGRMGWSTDCCDEDLRVGMTESSLERCIGGVEDTGPAAG